MNRSIYIFGLLLTGWLNAHGQVELEEQLIMTDTTNAGRQIRNVGDPSASDHLVNVISVQNGSLIFSPATGSNTLSVSLTPPIGAYVAGMVVNFMADSANSGAVTLNVNNLGVAPVRKAGGQELDSADIAANQMVTVIYDGSAFFVLSELSKACPSGFTVVTKDYCIELADRDSVSFWQANVTCHDMGARLCTWAEWYNACMNNGLGLLNMTDNREWVDHAANNQSNAKHAGPFGNTGNQLVDCRDGGNGPPENIRKFRCCFSR